uniref:Uncharacterized protein n=1 Tax=Anguilla anguilla TaxID=7936 RepID=A0A0E9Q158_ANGAN
MSLSCCFFAVGTCVRLNHV